MIWLFLLMLAAVVLGWFLGQWISEDDKVYEEEERKMLK